MDYLQKVTKKWGEKKFVCVGLDPEIEKIPQVLKEKTDDLEDIFFEFNKAIIDATATIAATFKPNSAFYEAEGEDGWEALEKTIKYIALTYPDIPVILDAKRADIGNTSRLYAKAAFEFFNADAVTVYPHVGKDAIQPFLEYENKTTFVLVKTSNPDSKMFMDIKVNGRPYYLLMSEEIASWNYKNIGVVVGATYPEEMKSIREIFPDAPFLSPGLGAQGGDVENIVRAGLDTHKMGIVFNSSRGIIYASNGEDFAEKAKEAAEKLNSEICLAIP